TVLPPPSWHSFPAAQTPFREETEQCEAKHGGRWPKRGGRSFHSRSHRLGEGTGKCAELLGSQGVAASLSGYRIQQCTVGREGTACLGCEVGAPAGDRTAHLRAL